MSRPSAAALRDLRAAECSNGAPSARNLLVTVFGDALLPHGPSTSVSVRALAVLLGAFGASERLVRTSLSRLVKDGLLDTHVEGRRSFYRVADTARDLFAQADARIYGSTPTAWDGSWTLVVIDGAESTPKQRARLRQELTWAGLGVVGPNVLASPVVPADVAAGVVARVGGFEHVLVSRSEVVDGEGTLGAERLARRCAPLDDLAQLYRAFTDRFEPFADAGSLAPEDAFKLRTLLVASFRRIALADPQLPAELLPADWIGTRARHVAGAVYRSVAAASEQRLLSTVVPPLGSGAPGLLDRFRVS